MGLGTCASTKCHLSGQVTPTLVSQYRCPRFTGGSGSSEGEVAYPTSSRSWSTAGLGGWKPKGG